MEIKSEIIQLKNYECTEIIKEISLSDSFIKYVENKRERPEYIVYQNKLFVRDWMEDYDEYNERIYWECMSNKQQEAQKITKRIHIYYEKQDYIVVED